MNLTGDAIERQRDWLRVDRATVQRLLDDCIANARDDLWGTARLMWESRLAQIDEELAALDAEPDR